MSRVEASLKKNENKKKVFRNLYQDFGVKPQHQNFQLVIMLE